MDVKKRSLRRTHSTRSELTAALSDPDCVMYKKISGCPSYKSAKQHESAKIDMTLQQHSTLRYYPLLPLRRTKNAHLPVSSSWKSSRRQWNRNFSKDNHHGTLVTESTPCWQILKLWQEPKLSESSSQHSQYTGQDQGWSSRVSRRAIWRRCTAKLSLLEWGTWIGQV